MKYIALIGLISMLTLTACNEGPAESMGEKIDDAVTDLGNAIKDVCNDVTDENCD